LPTCDSTLQTSTQWKLFLVAFGLATASRNETTLYIRHQTKDSAMHALRTPDSRFTDLPDYPWAPRYVEIDAGDGSGDRLRVHYVDDGPADAPHTVLCLHGEPSWSYLYRRVIPPLVAAGHRCVAPDLVGFGRSDKPAEQSDYTYERHVDWLDATVFGALDLHNVTLLCQDWGGLLGLRLVARHPDRFRAVVAANTFLPTGDRDPGPAFRAWREFSQTVPELPVGQILQRATETELSAAVVAAYDAPFPDESYKAGARRFPALVPATPDDPSSEPNRQAWAQLRQFRQPFLCAFSDQDAVTRGGDRALRDEIPGAAGQAHRTLHGGGHFLQEDVPEQLAEAVLELLA
jgi:haloalkane dehalogenase